MSGKKVIRIERRIEKLRPNSNLETVMSRLQIGLGPGDLMSKLGGPVSNALSSINSELYFIQLNERNTLLLSLQAPLNGFSAPLREWKVADAKIKKGLGQ
jgi:hypothetical protein